MYDKVLRHIRSDFKYLNSKKENRTLYYTPNSVIIVVEVVR